jgi:hypothetical protein
MNILEKERKKIAGVDPVRLPRPISPNNPPDRDTGDKSIRVLGRTAPPRPTADQGTRRKLLDAV